MNDPLDRPISVVETHSGTTTTTNLVYIGLADAIAKETLTGGTNTTKTYAYDPRGRRVTMSDGANRYSYLNDPHGSVSLLVDQNRTVKAAYGYTGYGSANSTLTKLAAGFNANSNVYRYSGKRWDSGSNSYDMGARRYSASTGRFLQRDAYDGAVANLGLAEDPLTGNRYALAAGNPVNYIEVDGHTAVWEGHGVWGGVRPGLPGLPGGWGAGAAAAGAAAGVVASEGQDALGPDELGSLGKPQQPPTGRGRKVLPQNDVPGGRKAAERDIERAAKYPGAKRIPRSGTRPDGGIKVRYKDGTEANYYPRSGKDKSGKPTIEIRDKNGTPVKKLRYGP